MVLLRTTRASCSVWIWNEVLWSCHGPKKRVDGIDNLQSNSYLRTKFSLGSSPLDELSNDAYPFLMQQWMILPPLQCSLTPEMLYVDKLDYCLGELLLRVVVHSMTRVPYRSEHVAFEATEKGRSGDRAGK